MNGREFLRKLCREGILDYETSWEDCFKYLQEFKKYKDMWEEFKEEHSFWLIGVLSATKPVKKYMECFEQKYFPKPPTIEEIDKFTKELMDFHGKLLKKYFGDV